jgi:hypothetical protein
MLKSLKRDKQIDVFPNAPGLSESLNLSQQENSSYKTRRGIWPFRQRFYSLCSVHRSKYLNPNCANCLIGSWKYDIPLWISQKVFKYFPRLWTWWANR